MFHRQKVYIGLAVAAGLCSTVGLLIYLRNRRQKSIGKGNSKRMISSSVNSDVEREKNRNNLLELCQDGTILTEEKCAVLIRFLTEADGEMLEKVLTTIANLGTLSENQEILINANCIEQLERILSTTTNSTIQLKVIFALNNLALNEKFLERFRKIVSKIVEILPKFPSESSTRRYAIQLLANLSLFDNLHDEFVKNIVDLDNFIASNWRVYDEILQSVKILVNLSTNKSNIDALFKLTTIDLKRIVNYCTPSKKSKTENQFEQLEELLLRFLTFYSNLTENVLKQLEKKGENANFIKSWITDPLPYGQGALYFELFDQDKQFSSKSILRPRYLSNDVNQEIGRFRQCLEKLIHIQFDASLIDSHNEFRENDLLHSVSEASTPKKSSTDDLNDLEDKENRFGDLSKVIQETFDESDDTILAGQASPSDQSLSSFRSALSVNENNLCASPEKTTFLET